MKRKAESHWEKIKRKKREKYHREHMYDSEKAYWKNASKQATREQASGIQDLFARGGAVTGSGSAIAGGVAVARNVASTLQSASWLLPVAREVLAPVLVEEGAAILAGLGGAVTGGVAIAGAAGYLAGQAIGSLFSQTNQNQIVEALMPGSYQGKIGLTARAAFKGLRDKYQKYGAVSIVEKFGAVADPDLVYIGHSTFNLGAISTTIATAILRKLFRIGVKFDGETQLEEVPLLNTGPDSGPDAYVIVYETRDSDGTRFTYEHVIANDKSIHDMVFFNQNSFQLNVNIESGMTDQNPQVLQKVYLYQVNNPNKRLMCQMDMQKEVLSIAMSSHMALQNRTKAAADGSSSTTQIDVQPLKGPVFQFATGVPHVRGTSPIQLTSMDDDGVILVRVGQFGGTDTAAWREPPVKKAFQKVVKSGYARLNPGAIKSMNIGADCYGFYHNVLNKLRYTSDGSTIGKCFGKSQLAVFEEELNSGSANNITVQYECQHCIGADFKTVKSPNQQPLYDAQAKSNLPS